MPEPERLADLTPEELADKIVLAAFELNLFIRAGLLMGMEILVDLVDQPDPAYPEHSLPRVQVRAGETGYPPVEPRVPGL